MCLMPSSSELCFVTVLCFPLPLTVSGCSIHQCLLIVQFFWDKGLLCIYIVSNKKKVLFMAEPIGSYIIQIIVIVHVKAEEKFRQSFLNSKIQRQVKSYPSSPMCVLWRFIRSCPKGINCHKWEIPYLWDRVRLSAQVNLALLLRVPKQM